MQKHCHLIMIFCFSLLVGCAHTAPTPKSLFENEFYPTQFQCEDTPWCKIKAVLKDWPKAPEMAASVLVSNLTFMFRLPTGFEKLTAVPNDKLPMLAAHYPGYNIAIALNEFSSALDLTPTSNAALNAEIVRAQASSKLVPTDVYRILFTVSSEEPEPENLYDRMMWRMAFIMKASKSYEPESPPEMYRNGKWTVYTWTRAEEPPQTQTAIITHEDFPARYLQVIGRGAPQAIFDYLISTLSLDR